MRLSFVSLEPFSFRSYRNGVWVFGLTRFLDAKRSAVMQLDAVTSSTAVG
jgi:hypothetical protein